MYTIYVFTLPFGLLVLLNIHSALKKKSTQMFYGNEFMCFGFCFKSVRIVKSLWAMCRYLATSAKPTPLPSNPSSILSFGQRFFTSVCWKREVWVYWTHSVVKYKQLCTKKIVKLYTVSVKAIYKENKFKTKANKRTTTKYIYTFKEASRSINLFLYPPLLH